MGDAGVTGPGGGADPGSFAERVAQLPPYLRAVLGEVVAGWDNASIAARTGLRPRSVSTLVARLYDLLGVPPGRDPRAWVVGQCHRAGVEVPAESGLADLLEDAAAEERRRLVEHKRAAGLHGALARHGDWLPVPGLRAARLARGWSQARLAEAAGLTNNRHVSQLELGGRAARETRARLARALGVGEDALTGG